VIGGAVYLLLLTVLRPSLTRELFGLLKLRRASSSAVVDG